jgi:hypothetical protein
MKKGQWFLPALAVVLAIAYVCFFSSWFRHKSIQIHYTSRARLARFSIFGLGVPSVNVMFGLDHAYRLTEVKVVSLDAMQTNQSAFPLWHLVSDSKSAWLNSFTYGEPIPNMKSAVPGAQPEPLQTNVVYRLLLSAGSVKGQCDFQIGGRPADSK